MINRTLARRLKHVEERLNPPRRSVTRIIIDLVDSQRKVVKSLVYEPGKGYVPYEPGFDTGDLADEDKTAQMSADVRR